jgi:hypothetical protein
LRRKCDNFSRKGDAFPNDLINLASPLIGRAAARYCAGDAATKRAARSSVVND